MTICLVLAVSLGVSPVQTVIQTTPAVLPSTPPPLEEIVERLVEHAQKDILLRRSYLIYTKVFTVEDLRRPLGQQVIKQEQSLVIGKDGKAYQRKIVENGVPLNPPVEERIYIEVDEILTSGRYVLSMAEPPETTIDGRRYWQLAFRPKNNLPDPDQDESLKDIPDSEKDKYKAFNALVGIIKVDAERYFIRRLDGHLEKDKKVGPGGPFGALFEFNITALHQEVSMNAGPGIIVPESIVISFYIRKFFNRTRERHTLIYGTFLPAKPPQE